MPHITLIKSKTTIRVSCHDHDVFIRCTHKGLLANPDNPYKMLDFWELRSGDSITITNKVEDLPSWFKIHPSEVSGDYVSSIMTTHNDKCSLTDITTGPNIWRARGGDCIAHLTNTESPEATITIYRINESAIILGEPGDYPINIKQYVFGCPDNWMDQELFKKHVKTALSHISKLGNANKITTGKWTIGSWT